jgi:hypothetical protein
VIKIFLQGVPVYLVTHHTQVLPADKAVKALASNGRGHHGCFEGPESGVTHRRNGSGRWLNVIKPIPDHRIEFTRRGADPELYTFNAGHGRDCDSSRTDRQQKFPASDIHFALLSKLRAREGLRHTQYRVSESPKRL